MSERGPPAKENPDRVEVFEAAIGHLLKKLLKKETSIVVCSHEELGLTDVPFVYALELTDYTTVCPLMRRIPARHIEVIKNKISIMLSARIIKTATFPWRILIADSGKTAGSARFCVDHWALIKQMKGENIL